NYTKQNQKEWNMYFCHYDLSFLFVKNEGMEPCRMDRNSGRLVFIEEALRRGRRSSRLLELPREALRLLPLMQPLLFPKGAPAVLPHPEKRQRSRMLSAQGEFRTTQSWPALPGRSVGRRVKSFQPPPLFPVLLLTERIML